MQQDYLQRTPTTTVQIVRGVGWGALVWLLGTPLVVGILAGIITSVIGEKSIPFSGLTGSLFVLIPGILLSILAMRNKLIRDYKTAKIAFIVTSLAIILPITLFIWSLFERVAQLD